MRRFIHLNLLAVFALIVAGCSSPGGASFKRPVNDPNGNLHLDVSNQSFAVSPVDIKVFIDGELVVKSDYFIGGADYWQTFVLKLSTGRHKVVAESSKGRARLKQTFEVNDKVWAALAYWYNPKREGGAEPCPRQFTFIVKNEPIYHY